MTKRIFHATNYTPTAQADTTALTSGTYQALKGGSSTQIVQIIDIYIAGLASTTSPTLMQLAKASTVETTPTALATPNTDGFMISAGTLLVSGDNPVTFVAAATGPSRSAVVTDPKMGLELNAFGGIVRVQLPPGEEWVQVGETATQGESVLSAFTGGTVGAISSHLIYEPF